MKTIALVAVILVMSRGSQIQWGQHEFCKTEQKYCGKMFKKTPKIWMAGIHFPNIVLPPIWFRHVYPKYYDWTWRILALSRNAIQDTPMPNWGGKGCSNDKNFGAGLFMKPISPVKERGETPIYLFELFWLFLGHDASAHCLNSCMKKETRMPHRIPMPASGSHRKWKRSHTWADILEDVPWEEHDSYTHFNRHIRFDVTFFIEAVFILWDKVKLDDRLDFEERVSDNYVCAGRKKLWGSIFYVSLISRWVH